MPEMVGAVSFEEDTGSGSEQIVEATEGQAGRGHVLEIFHGIGYFTMNADVVEGQTSSGVDMYLSRVVFVPSDLVSEEAAFITAPDLQGPCHSLGGNLRTGTHGT